MTSFIIRKRSEIVDLHHPLTIIATHQTIASALDSLPLADDMRKAADHLWKIENPKGGSIYPLAGDDVVRLSCIVLEDTKSRHMPKINVFQLQKNLKSDYFAEKNVQFIIFLESDDCDAYASVVAEIVRACPEFSRKTDHKAADQIEIIVAGNLNGNDMLRLQGIADTVSMVSRLVDTPTLEMGTDDMMKMVVAQATKLGLSIEIIDGEDLKKRGFGGLYHVGKSGVTQPKMVILGYHADNPKLNIALVGKGIVYDTGGLCLKPKDHMTTMKSDMAGAASVFGAIRMAALTRIDCDVTAILCLAENGIGPKALRPDDIIQLYSGMTVEINNTDAEGRLVLADGVAYASRHLKPDIIIDMATLTGAQLLTTGKRHAGILSSDEDLEKLIFEAGRACGEPVFPLLYAPEILFTEFKSELADMKNSCKDRMNAQTSCAGHFVEKHLSKDWHGKFCHIDIAGPSWKDERATGYGVLLLNTVLRALTALPR